MTEDRRDAPLTPRKAVLLQAAAELFAARGFRAVSIDEIGHAAGISGPGVYRHFATKADILLRLCHDAMDHLLTGARDIVDARETGPRALADLVAFHIDFAVRERAILAVYLREQRELPPRDLRALRVRQRDYERIWWSAVREASDMPVSEARAVIKFLLSMLNGTAHVKDAVPRRQLVELLRRLAGGALAEAGVAVHPPGVAAHAGRSD